MARMYIPFIQSSFSMSNTAADCETRAEIELPDQRVPGEDFVPAFGGPGQQRKEIDERLGKVARLAVLVHGRGPVPFGQTLPVLSENHGDVRERRGSPSRSAL